jgi:hypothetical protein
MTAAAAAADDFDGDELAGITAAFRHARDASLRDPAATAEFCDPGYARRPHLDLMAEELADVLAGHTQRLLVRVPPQTGKTTQVAVWGSFWWLANRPRASVMIGGYNNNLAVNRGRQIRKLVQRHGWRYDLALEWGASQVADWRLESGGGVKSVGVGGGATGSPSDFTCVDDPHKSREEAESKAKRDRVWDWYSADFLSRLSPGAPLVMIVTPWHEDDLSYRVLKQDGRIEEGGIWRVVDLPAFAGADDQMGREPGAPLTHPLIPVEDVAAQRVFWEGRRSQSSERDWASIYMLNPKPVTNALVSRDLIKERTHHNPKVQPRRAVVAVDPSGGKRDTAGIVGGYLADDSRVYISHDRSLVGPSEIWGREAALLAADIDADLISFEPNFGGDMAGVIIRAAWQQLRDELPDDPRFARLPPRVKPAKAAKKNKLLRAEPIAQQISDDRLRFAAHLPELFAEWWSWRPTDTESPGRIDASVYLALELLPIDNNPAQLDIPPATRVAPPPAVPLGGTRGIGVTPSLSDLQRRRPPRR